MRLIVMPIVQLEDARATGSVSCPIALWKYSRGIVAITRLRKKLGTHSSIRRNTDQNHTQPQNSILSLLFFLLFYSGLWF